ncbi:MAG: PQQ-binding-like beta-propeller repeat protein [Bdellovibrionales bacterium]|nr:PQQ-binding-like beta-propeller repeat protein [Bdellovibrionales bacterium]
MLRTINGFFLLLPLLMGGCAHRTNTNPDKVRLERSWSRSTVNDKYMGFTDPATISPLIYKDVVISGNGTDAIMGFNKKTGNEIWRIPLKNGAEGAFIDEKGFLYFGSNNGLFYQVQAETGQVVWSYPIFSESTGAPLVKGTYVFHLAMNGSLYALESDSGRAIWIKSRPPRDPISIRGSTQPLFEDGRVYVGYSDGYFVAYNATDGTKLWEKRMSDNKKFNDVDARPATTSKCVIVANAIDSISCLDKITGNTLWQSAEGGSSQAVLVVNNTVIYSTDNSVVMLDSDSGRLKKKYAIDKKYGNITAPVALEKWVFVGTGEGPILVIDTQTHRIIETFSTGRGISAPMTYDESTRSFYVTSNQGNIYRLLFKSKPEKVAAIKSSKKSIKK